LILLSIIKLQRSATIVIASDKRNLPHCAKDFSLLDIGENRRLKPAVLAAFFAFVDELSESAGARNSVWASRIGRS
jgi:hypothetical protein